MSKSMSKSKSEPISGVIPQATLAAAHPVAHLLGPGAVAPEPDLGHAVPISTSVGEA